MVKPKIDKTVLITCSTYGQFMHTFKTFNFADANTSSITIIGKLDYHTLIAIEIEKRKLLRTSYIVTLKADYDEDNVPQFVKTQSFDKLSTFKTRMYDMVNKIAKEILEVKL